MSSLSIFVGCFTIYVLVGLNWSNLQPSNIGNIFFCILFLFKIKNIQYTYVEKK